MRMSDTPSATMAQAENLIETYLRPGAPTEVNVSDELRISIGEGFDKGNAGSLELVIAFKLAQAEIIKIMALGAFPRFITSVAFAEYRVSSKKLAVDAMVSQVYHRISMANELEYLLVSTSWLKRLLTSVENLPVCVSIATANKEMRGFPLIYVNKTFETTTGYSRKEIIGQNCRFLQIGKKVGHTSEVECVSKMSVGLRDNKHIKVAITNFRKDGTPFRNLLAMKPIFDTNGEYSFVLGLQFDIGLKDACAEKIQFIDALFSVIPNTMMAGAYMHVYINICICVRIYTHSMNIYRCILAYICNKISPTNIHL